MSSHQHSFDLDELPPLEEEADDEFMQALAAENDAVQPAKTLLALAENGGRFVDLDLGGLKTG